MSAEEIGKLSTSELTKAIEQRRNELYLLCKEQSRRIGDVPKNGIMVDFEKYVTK